MPTIDDYEFGYYYFLRSEARRRVIEDLNRRIKEQGGRSNWDRLTLSSINRKSLEYARLEWPKHYGENTHKGLPHSWESLFFKFAPRPSYFDLAVWQTIEGVEVLQGMALGKPSNGKTHLSVNWVERSFAPTYFRGGVLLPILACAEEYAKLLGSQRVVIKDAVDPTIYERYGYKSYTIHRAGTHLAKEI